MHWIKANWISLLNLMISSMTLVYVHYILSVAAGNQGFLIHIINHI